MSAESPRRGVHKGAQIVSPQPIVDRSIIDSVAGIINDIVPQGYAGASNSENKETISWARFEYADVNDPTLYPDYNEGSSTPPLLLVLGYTTGVQVWLIAATGEATEVLSWRQGVVRTLRILPNPKTDDEQVDPFEAKRPMVAICDSAGPGPQFCHISFISLKTGEQVKSIKFKNPVCDVLANRRSIVVTFVEKIAVFDARTLEDVITITTCYASPGPNPNPVALGTRWLAYSEKKLIPARRSSGGCEGEGVQSYTATVLYAAKSLGKGLRGLGETVASSLTGNSVSPMTINNTGNDITQPGVVTILDLQAAKEEKELDDANIETVIAHFTAHSDAIVAMTFDLTGALLMTADKRGHDFHVFRIQPHPGGPTLAAVHHLYILHRGDTSAKVQDMVFSSDTRWAAVSTVRGTTHVFPVAPYGGPVGVRTHSTPHVVNRLSRFHKSAGLTDDGTRSHSPVSHAELPLSVYPYSNPRLPPYPHPTILHPLSQIRQPSSLNHVNSSSQPSSKDTNEECRAYYSRPQQRQRLHSDDGGTLPLKICVCFAPPRAWMYAQRESSSKVIKRAVDSLFIMACHGNMIQYDLEPKAAAGVPKEKVCDDTTIELEVEAKGQWPLLRTPNSSEIAPPLPLSSPLLSVTFAPKTSRELDTTEDRWLSQVEIVTHAGPHRRLWMGPQFVFKTYNAPSGVAVNLVEAEAVEVGITSGGSRPARSKPVNMPHASSKPLMPVVIDGSGSSYEQSPRFMEAYGDPLDSENVAVGSCESQLREDLAEAMLEISIASQRAPGRRSVFERVGQPVTKVVNPLGTVITVSADEEDVVNNSSQELFDSAEEILAPPEAPRSVCAEEGPASLGDLEPPECGQTLRDLTEICAEMRSASEPAIDSVPDENIRELKERRALCAEILATTSGDGNAGDVHNSSSIDFEKEEAFREVPTSLSLCAEEGEIPNSPMTRAKETVWCSKRLVSGKHDDHTTREKSFAKVKYVVNYDDDSVTLMENKATTMLESRSERTGSTDADEYGGVTRTTSKKPVKARTVGRIDVIDSEKASRKFQPTRSSSSSSDTAQRCWTEQSTRVEKYVIKENEDSVIIEDARDSTSARARRENVRVEKYGNKRTESARDVGEAAREKSSDTAVWCKSRSSGKKDVMREDIERATKSFVLGLREPESTTDEITRRREKCAFPKVKARLRTTSVDDEGDNDDELPPLDPPPLDDFSSIEYHMVAEATNCPSSRDATTSSTQSDDDIEHIQIDSSEVMQLRERTDTLNRKCCGDVVRSYGQELSPVAQRKSSKSTISDDDLEYIHTSELSDALPERGDFGVATKSVGKDCYLRASGRRSSRHALSSDDDLEHVQHSEIRELERASLAASQRSSLERTAQEGSPIEHRGSKSSKLSKKRKDVMPIENEMANTAEISAVHKSSEEETQRGDMAQLERFDVKYGADHPCKDKQVEATYPTSPARKARSRASKTSSSLSLSSKRIIQTAADLVEIINIDAMQKAEMGAAAVVDVPECKILPLCHDAAAAAAAAAAAVVATAAGMRAKKPRKSRKSCADGQSQLDSKMEFRSSKVKMAELQEAVEELLVIDPKSQSSPKSPVPTATAEMSWSSIVKKNVSASSSDSEATSHAKETDLEPLLEVEERSVDGEHARKLPECLREGRGGGFESSSGRATCRREGARQVLGLKEGLGGDGNVVGTTTTATMEENLLVNLPAAAMRENEGKLLLRGDDVARKDVRTDETATKDGTLVPADVDRRRRRFVDDSTETRRGNAAVRGESQESSLQLTTARWRQRQVENVPASENRNIDERRDESLIGVASSKEISLESRQSVSEIVALEKQSVSEERGGGELSQAEYSISLSDESNNAATTFVAHGGGNCGDDYLCCSLQDTTEKDNGSDTTSLVTAISASAKKGSRSKKKKRR